MDMTQFTTGKYLDKSEVDQTTGQNIQIDDVQVQDIGDSDMKPVLLSSHLKKPMILNKTNIKIMGALCGSMNSDAWKGKQVNIYNDPTVMYAGQVVGGLRVRPVQQFQQPQTQPMQPVTYPPGAPQGSGAQPQQGPQGQYTPGEDPDIPF